MAVRYGSKFDGEFLNENNVWFTYEKMTEATCEWSAAWNAGCNVKIHTTDSFRYAILAKTVVYVAVDENQDGTPVFERWKLKNNKSFTF